MKKLIPFPFLRLGTLVLPLSGPQRHSADRESFIGNIILSFPDAPPDQYKESDHHARMIKIDK